MPLEKVEDYAGGDEHSNFCQYCADADGNVKSCEEIFEGGVQFFMSQIGDDRGLAERITRRNMRLQPYWQGREYPALQGDIATDEEFEEVLRKL